MKNFLYNLRRNYLHLKRRHRIGVRNFTIAFILIIIVLFVMSLTVFPHNAIKAMFVKRNVTIEATMTPDVNTKPTSTPEPTPVVTPSATMVPTPTVTPDPNAPLTPLPVTDNTQTRTGYIVAPSGLVVRTGPSLEHRRLGTLPYGMKVEIIKQGEYFFIEYKNGGGYIHSKYVVISDYPPGMNSSNS